MALRGTPVPAAGFLHEHYNYRMKFNNINKRNMLSSCDKCSQIDLRRCQSDKEYWKIKTNLGVDYLAFVGDSHCCSIKTVTVTSQASSATAARCFPVTTVLSEVHLNTAPTFNYIGQEFLHLFDSRLAMVQPLLTNVRKMRGKVCEFVTAPDNSTANVVAQSLLSIINSTEDQLESNFLTVDKEIQFNDWLFGKLDCLLSPQGFVVRPNKPIKEIVPNVCEYSTLQPDCVVYHARQPSHGCDHPNRG